MSVVIGSPGEQSKQLGVENRYVIEQLGDGLQFGDWYIAACSHCHDHAHDAPLAEGHAHALTGLQTRVVEAGQQAVIKEAPQGRVDGDLDESIHVKWKSVRRVPTN